MAVTIVRFEPYNEEDRSDDIHIVPLSATLRAAALDGDVLATFMGGDRYQVPGPPLMSDGTAYGSAGWDTDTYVYFSSTGSSWVSFIELTDASALPATITADFEGALRGGVWNIYLLRGVDVPLIERWTSESYSYPSFGENADLNSGAGVTYDESLVISITANTGEIKVIETLDPGPWTVDAQQVWVSSPGSWGVAGHIFVDAGTLAKQDIRVGSASDACCTLAFPAAAVLPPTEDFVVDLTGSPHLQDLRLNPQIKVQGGRVATRAARQMFSKFDGLNRGLLVRAWYDAGWQVTPYPGTDTMTVDETIEATSVWRGGTLGVIEDDIGGLVAALTTAGYTVPEWTPGFSSGFNEGFDVT